MNLGEQIKQRFIELFNLDIGFEGCTDEEIEQVEHFQNITHIPRCYRELLQVMGHKGLSWIAMGEADWNLLEAAKIDFLSMMKYHKLPFPDDLLVFYSELDSFYFCRTGAQQDDPPVYGYSYGWKLQGFSTSGIVKLAETLSEFWFSLLFDHKRVLDKLGETWQPLAEAYYDIERDEYLTDQTLDRYSSPQT